MFRALKLLSLGIAATLLSLASSAPVGAAVNPREGSAQTIILGNAAEGRIASRPASAPQARHGILQEDRVGLVSDLAARLSRDRAWLTQDTLKELGQRALALDEVFQNAPRYVTVGEHSYRIKLEKVGRLWKGFDPAAGNFIIFLTHEVYDGLGTERALGYLNGEEMVLDGSDLDRFPALALTLSKSMAEDAAGGFRLESAPIPLGAAREKVAFRPEGEAPAKRPAVAVSPKVDCPVEVRPQCVIGGLGCSAGYSPYFVVSQLKVIENHEGCCFHGDPEIELYGVHYDFLEPTVGSFGPTTPYVFSGRTITDASGQSRYLPDIDDNGAWYTVNLAAYAIPLFVNYSSLLVEDDNGTGFFVSGDDDLYNPIFGVTTAQFCSDPTTNFPRVYTFESNEWGLKGYFACINPACAPPPPPPPPGPPPPPDSGDPCGSTDENPRPCIN